MKERDQEKEHQDTTITRKESFKGRKRHPRRRTDESMSTNRPHQAELPCS